MKLYEEILLLVLRDEKGSFIENYVEQLVAGAVVAELLLDGRIKVDDDRKQTVHLDDASPTGDPVMDAAIRKMDESRKPKTLNIWIGELAHISDLRHMVARQLVEDGILRMEEQKVLLVFTRKLYPEVTPEPERAVIERLRNAIFYQSGEVDPRTAVLVALAEGSYLLPQIFGRKELKPYRKRIKAISDGSLVGSATQQVIMGLQAAAVTSSVIVGAM
jgi:hypothetical protein